MFSSIPNEMHTLCPTNLARIHTDLPLSPLTSETSEFQPRKDEIETTLQKCWDQSISKHMDRPDGYQAVHVLVIKWHDDIDQLHVREEVNELSDVFRNDFNYNVTEVQLRTSNVQLQLLGEISTWAFKNDNPDNLLIIYYAGHGIYDKATRVLAITPTNDQEKSPEVIWNKAESIFVDTVQADVFAIMDCCFASDLLRNVPEQGRTYEMLCASHIGLTTAQPGEYSFTNSLIKHLRELATEHADSFFTTRDIFERMQKELKIQHPALWRRVPGTSRHIRLGKLKPLPERVKQAQNHELPSPPARFLHLGFALKNEAFGEKHIEGLTKKLPALFKDEGIPVVDIKWLGYRIVGSHSFKEVANFVFEHRKNLSAISPGREQKRNATDMETKSDQREHTSWPKRRKHGGGGGVKHGGSKSASRDG